MVIFMIIQVQIATDKDLLIDPTILEFKNTENECREDQAAKNYLNLILIESFNNIFILHGVGLARFLLKRVLTCNKDWKPEFEVSKYIVWVLYFQLLLWYSLIIFPILAILQPFLMYIIFKSYYFFLTYAKKPQANSIKDETAYLM